MKPVRKTLAICLGVMRAQPEGVTPLDGVQILRDSTFSTGPVGITSNVHQPGRSVASGGKPRAPGAA